MTTPHIAAAPDELAPVVLMPGDPLRARFIAETFLTDARQVTDVRAVCGFTGTHAGRPVSVLAHGMGIPSMLIYATELVRFFGCETLIRVGSCGGLVDDLALGDVVVASAAGTDSGVNRSRIGGHDYPAVADFDLLRAAVDGAARQGLIARVAPVFTSDVFYGDDRDFMTTLAANGMVAIEMETAGLYGVAAAEGARAVSLLTVTDLVGREERMTTEQRATGLHAMVELALAVASAA